MLALVHTAHTDREEHRVVEGRRAREVGDLDSKVVDHRRSLTHPAAPPRQESRERLSMSRWVTATVRVSCSR